MLFRDDKCRIRTANAPANFTTIAPYQLLPPPPTAFAHTVALRIAASTYAASFESYECCLQISAWLEEELHP